MPPRGGGRLGAGGDPTSTCATAVVERGRGRLTRPAPSEGGGEGGGGVVLWLLLLLLLLWRRRRSRCA